MSTAPSPQRRVLALTVTLMMVLWPVVGAIGAVGPVAIAAGNEAGSTGSGTATGSSPFAGGNGTVGDPYQVADWHDLDAVREDLSVKYVLVSGLDETTTGYEEVAGPRANGGAGFEPVGNSSRPFTGTFDGGEHTISDFKVTGSARSGIFSTISGGANIENVTVTDAVVSGSSAGSLVGQVESGGGTIENSHAENVSVSGTGFVYGGLVGYLNRNATVRNVSVTSVNLAGGGDAGGLAGLVIGDVTIRNATVESSIEVEKGDESVGGLVGSVGGNRERARIVRSAAIGNVTGQSRGGVGGLVGIARDADIVESYSRGAVTGDSNVVGGLLGAAGQGTATVNTFSIGPVKGNRYVGGLVGNHLETASLAPTIQNSYSVGSVDGQTDVGGLVGANTGNVFRSYWDSETAGLSDSAGGIPLTTAEMTGEAARENMSGFDFESVWETTSRYPELRALDSEPSRQIEDWKDVEAVREAPGGDYVLANDLDEATPGYEEVAGPNANNGSGFDPIGNGSEPFTGTFDGAGNTISGLTVDRAGTNTIGLFGANDGTVSNVTLSDTTVTGDTRVGALAGVNTGTVTGISAQVDVNGSGDFVGSVGGLVGENRGGTVADASARGTVTSDGGIAGIGGLVGRNDNGATIRNTTAGTTVRAPGLGSVGGVAGVNANGSTVQRSAAVGGVTGQNSVGGLVGFNSGAGENSTIVDAYSTGAVEGDRSVGGLVGRNDDGAELSRTYSRGAATGTEEVGGLVGENADSTVRKSYSTGAVAGDTRAGGLIGLDTDGEVVGSYWDTDASGRTVSGGGTGLTTAEMTGDAGRESMTAFDFRDTWIVLEDDSYPELRTFLPGEAPEFRVTNVQFDPYLRSADGQVVTVNITNRGDKPDTQDVTYRIPTEDAPRPSEVVETVRFREAVTLEAGESKTFDFRLPDIQFKPPADVGFQVVYDRGSEQGGEAVRIINNGSEPIPANEVVVDGTNVSGVDGPTLLADLPVVADNETLAPDESVSIPATNRTVTLRVIGTVPVNTTLATADRSQNVSLYMLPATQRPVPRILTAEQPIPVNVENRFEVGSSVTSYVNDRGSDAVGITWDLNAPPVGQVSRTGPQAIGRYLGGGVVPVGASVDYATPETTFRTERVQVGTPERIPPILGEIENTGAYYISDPDGELNSAGSTAIQAEFRARFLAPEQVDEVTFAPNWVEDSNVTVTDGSDGWSATFDVSEIPDTDEGTGPDTALTVVAVDDEGTTVAEQGLYVTDPPEWAERVYRSGGPSLTVDDGTVREAIQIPAGGFDATVDPPKGVPIVGGKTVGLSGAAGYGVETYQFERYASRYGEGSLEVGVPVSAVVNVNQSTTVGAVAEYGVPEWDLNGKARFYVNARTLLTRPVPIRAPGSIPVVGGRGFNVSGYAGPGYGVELELSGIQGGTLTLDEALGYANFAAGAEGGAGVAGQEAFASIDGQVEGNGKATIDNTPNRFSSISLSGIDLGGRITGEAGARIRAPRIGGEYSDSITFVSLGSKSIEQPGPPFTKLSSATVAPPSPSGAATSFKLDGSHPGPLSRSPYGPADGQLTDNNLNDTDPAIGGSHGSYTVAWSGDALNRPQPERAEIYVRDYVDRTFGERTRLTNDTAYNVDPTVARAPDGTTIVAWARIENDRLRTISNTNLTFQNVRNQSEVAYAVNDGTGWSETRVLTTDTRYQGAPVAAGFDGGFVVAYEQDGDFDYTTRDDETVEYARLTAAGEPVENGTLGNGLNPRAATAGDGTAVRVVRERPTTDPATDVVVASVGDAGVTTTRTESVTNLTTVDIATDAVAWANTTTEGASSVTVANESVTRRVPLENGTTVRELRLATAGDRRLLQYQGTNPTVDTGFLPNARTTYYQRFRNGSWSPARTVNQAVNTTQILYDHAVTSDAESFVSVAAGVDFGGPDAVDDLYYVDHEYRPDLTVSIPAEERDATADAAIGEPVEMNVTVANTGDTGTGRSVVLAVGNGTGETTSTMTLDPITPGKERTVSVTATVTRTGQLRVVADRSGAIQELTEANNDATVVVERPRLTITDAEQTLIGDTLRVNATVRNDGEAVVTNAAARLVNGDRRASTALTEQLAPGETREVSLTPSLVMLNASQPGYVSVRATAPSKQQVGSRETLPLQQAGPTVVDRSLRAFRAGNTTAIAVTIENEGLEGAQRTLQVEYGDDQRARQVCVPPATQDRPTTYRRAVVTTPGLNEGTTVTASLRANVSENATRAVPATSGGTAVRAEVQPAERTTPPVVVGRVPVDVDCDGAYEDFDRDGAVTTSDAEILFSARNTEPVRTQRPRFDGNNDSRITIHDVQTVLADAGTAESSAQNTVEVTAQADSQQAQVQPATTDLAVPVNGTRRLTVAVPDKPIGAFNMTARIRGTAATVTGMSAAGSNVSERLTDRDGGPAIVAAGHGANDTILEIVVAGQSPSDVELVIDTQGVSDNTGTLYESPDEVAVSVNVTERPVDSGAGSGGSNGDSGSNDAAGPDDGAESASQEPQIDITDLPDGIEATVRNVDDGDSVTIGPATVRAGSLVVTRVTATFDEGSTAASHVRVDAKEQLPVDASSPETPAVLGYVTVDVNGSLDRATAEGSFTVRAENQTAVTRPEAVQAYRYDDGTQSWESVTTQHLGGQRFRVETGGFSTFAVALNQSQPQVTQTPTPAQTQTETAVETVTDTETATETTTPSRERGGLNLPQLVGSFVLLLAVLGAVYILRRR